MQNPKRFPRIKSWCNDACGDLKVLIENLIRDMGYLAKVKKEVKPTLTIGNLARFVKDELEDILSALLGHFGSFSQVQ
jgi:hypothetical protein